MRMESQTLPLGAVRTADGRVEIPESKRADGSTRRAIRVRAGYVPQDEVRAYRTPAQRRREEEQQRRGQEERAGSSGSAAGARKDSSSGRSSDDTSDLSLASLSLHEAASSPKLRQEPAREAKDGKARTREERPRQASSSQAPRSSRQGTGEADRNAHLKKEITRINRLLKDIAVLEKAAPDSLTPAQQKKVARKSELQREKSAVIAELNGATVKQTATATATGKTRAVISL